MSAWCVDEWWVTPEPVIGPGFARTRWANPPYEFCALTKMAPGQGAILH
jgi:hypothetical protein